MSRWKNKNVEQPNPVSRRFDVPDDSVLIDTRKRTAHAFFFEDDEMSKPLQGSSQWQADGMFKLVPILFYQIRASIHKWITLRLLASSMLAQKRRNHTIRHSLTGSHCNTNFIFQPNSVDQPNIELVSMNALNKYFCSTTLKAMMRQFVPNTKFGPQTDSDQKQIRPKILITSI